MLFVGFATKIKYSYDEAKMIRNDLVASDELKDTLQRLSVIMESKILELQMSEKLSYALSIPIRHLQLKNLTLHDDR